MKHQLPFSLVGKTGTWYKTGQKREKINNDTCKSNWVSKKAKCKSIKLI